MVVIPRYEPVFVEPNHKEYEVQVLQMSVNMDDVDPAKMDFSRHQRFDPGFNLDSVSYITHDTSTSERVEMLEVMESNDDMVFRYQQSQQWSRPAQSVNMAGRYSDWTPSGEESLQQDQAAAGARQVSSGLQTGGEGEGGDNNDY